MGNNRITQYQETFVAIQEQSTNLKNSFRPQVIKSKLKLLAGIYEGNYSIAVEGDSIQLKLSSTSLISVKNISQDDKSLLVFLLEDEELLDIFISFAIDLETLIQKNDNITLLEIYNRYTYWLKMFKTINSVASESTIKGLINELYILDEIMIPKYGVQDALSGWIGSDNAQKDFAYGNGVWYESKAINFGKGTVKISSIEQLQSDFNGYLLINEFESTSSDNSKGYNLFVILNKIKNQIDSEMDLILFYEKIANLGFQLKIFTDEDLEENSYRYIIHNERAYLVDGNFPRLVRENLPTGIGKVEYEIILSDIEEFKVDLKDGEN